MLEPGPRDTITLLLAAYAALLSTVLGLRELGKARRSLRIFLNYVAFNESYTVTLTNAGFRPITITSLVIDIPNAGPVKPAEILA